MSEHLNANNLPRGGLRGIRILRDRRMAQMAPNLTPAELAEIAYRRREQERRKERDYDAYVDSSQRTPEELEQRRLDRLQRKLYRDSEDVSQLTPLQHSARELEIARNEGNELFNSPEVLQLDMQTSEGRRRLSELRSEARKRRLAAEAQERLSGYMNTANNNGPVEVKSIGTGGIIPESNRWEQEAQSNMTPAQIAAAARKELGWRQYLPGGLFGRRKGGGYTKHRKTRGRKSRGTRRRR